MSADEDALPRFPKEGDRLFPLVRDWDIEIPATPSGQADFMIRGYKRAGDELLELTLSDPAIKPALVYPIVFCYRQFIELSLKDLIDNFGERPNEKSHGTKKRPIHDLRNLLEQISRLDKADTTNSLAQEISTTCRVA